MALMGQLYLVRHGQASFGADDYDQLSELGQRQSRRLGEHWAERGVVFDAVITGTLKRHAQTWAGIASGAGIDAVLDNDPIAQYRVERYGFGLNFGRQIGNNGEVRFGVGEAWGKADVRIGATRIVLAGSLTDPQNLGALDRV